MLRMKSAFLSAAEESKYRLVSSRECQYVFMVYQVIIAGSSLILKSNDVCCRVIEMY